MRDKVLPARVVGGESGKKFSLRAKSGPKSAFWGVPGEFCTGWAAEPGGRESFVPVDPVEPGGRESFVPVDPVEPGSRASFVSLRARRGLHRAFFAPIAPPIDAAVMRCRFTWARWPCPTGQREPHPGSVGSFIAPRKPPAHASCGGGRYRKECMGCKQTRATRGTLAPPSISRHQQAAQATQASQPNLAVQPSRTHFFSSVTRYTLVSRSWNPARW